MRFFWTVYGFTAKPCISPLTPPSVRGISFIENVCISSIHTSDFSLFKKEHNNEELLPYLHLTWYCFRIVRIEAERGELPTALLYPSILPIH